MQVPLNVRTEEIKNLLCAKLAERGVFCSPAVAGGAEQGAVSGVPAPLPQLPVQSAGMTAVTLTHAHYREAEIMPICKYDK